MVIEFIGTPGAGKTTLMGLVVESLAARGITAWPVNEAARPLAARTLPGRVIDRLAPDAWQGPLLWQTFYHLSKASRLRFFAGHRELIWSVWRFQRTRPIGRADHAHVSGWFYHLTGVYEFLRSLTRPDEALLFDEGFSHRVVQLFASECETVDPARVRAYVDLVPPPDLLIVARAPRDVCERRVHARGLWDRFRHKTPDATARFLAQAEIAVDCAVGRARESGWKVLEIDNGGDDPGPARMALGELLSTCAFAPRPAAVALPHSAW